MNEEEDDYAAVCSFCSGIEPGCLPRGMIPEQAFILHTLLRLVEGQVVLAFSPEEILSGMLAYCLSEMYGFPLEFAVDEMERNGVTVNEER